MRFLITAIGSFSAQTILNSLKNDLKAYIVGCNIYPPEWFSISKICDKTYKVPSCNSENEYKKAIITICENNNLNYIIPLTDIEVDFFNRNRNYFLENNITICISNESSIDIMRNKYTFYSLFKNDIHVNTIPTFLKGENSLNEIPLPCIAKPYNGRSSEGLLFIENEQELKNAYKKDNLIFQKYLNGDIFTVDYIRDQNTGDEFMISRKELLRTKNGAGLVISLINNEKLTKHLSYIGEKININGCVNIEFILFEDKFYIMDINPRFSAGIAFSLLAGYNFVISHVNCFTGKNILPKINYKEQLMTKEYIETIL